MIYATLCKQSKHKIIHGSKTALKGTIDNRFGGKLCVGYALEIDEQENILNVYALYATDIIIEKWNVKLVSSKAIIKDK